MRSLEEAFDFFCAAQEVHPAQRPVMRELWISTLEPYRKSGCRALEILALGAPTYRPRLAAVVCKAEELICPPVDPITVWQEALAEARRTGPMTADLHPAVLGALEYVGIARLRACEGISYLKTELERYVQSYNMRPFAERAELQNIATREQLMTLPSARAWLER